MVMVTRSALKKCNNGFESSAESENRIMIAPPWCSLAKSQGKKKVVKLSADSWETRSLSPLRTDICEYLRGDKRKLYKRKQRRHGCKQTSAQNKGVCKTLICFTFVFITVGLMISAVLWMPDTIPQTALISSIINRNYLISLLGLEPSLVQEECCSRMKYLVAELIRAEQALKSTIRVRKTLMLTSESNKFDTTIDRGYIRGISVTRGKDTKEWGGRSALLGVVPLWREAPPPHTVLSLDKPVPSHCWPFSGDTGELNFELPAKQPLRCISVEHIYPDTASSAPKHFVLYGVLSNGTLLETVNAEYKHRGPPKQYYQIRQHNVILQHFIFRILSNQGNPRYTCVYRIHFYGNANGRPRDS